MAKVLGVLAAVLGAWGSAAQADEQGRWQALENNPSCSVWNDHPDHPDASETVTWTGDCVSGRADGDGSGVWRFLDDGEWRAIEYTGEMRDGKENGRGVKVYSGGTRYALLASVDSRSPSNSSCIKLPTCANACRVASSALIARRETRAKATLV